MPTESVECSRCGAMFDSENDLMAHSIDTHAGEQSPGMGSEGSAPGEQGIKDLNAEAADRLLRLLEERATSADTVLVRYGQRFLLVAGVAVLGIAVTLSYLHVTGILGIAVYMFSLGTLFGLTIAYLQAYLQSARR